MASSVPPPELSYQPDFSAYRARTQYRLQTEKLEKALPKNYPTQLRSPLVWESRDFTVDENGNEQWVYALNSEQLDEIHHALGHFRYNLLIYAGISCYIGSVRGRQDHQYNGRLADVVIAHVKDFGPQSNGVGLASCTTDEIPFHTDVGDIVSLLALDVPARGGESLIASSWRIYNELAASRPDLIQTLADDWKIPRADASGNSYSQRPLLFHQPSINGDPERVILQFSRRSFTGFRAQRHVSDRPPITEAQAEALDALQFLAEKFYLSHSLKKGEVQYINNLSIVHARKGFMDDENNQRHLLRLWLRDPTYAWQTPEALRDRWSKTYDMPNEDNQVFPLEPSIRSAARLAQGSAPNPATI